ncbi:MAG: hypothetical protein R3B82_05730 [Sandaracinaceae bacterium]
MGSSLTVRMTCRFAPGGVDRWLARSITYPRFAASYLAPTESTVGDLLYRLAGGLSVGEIAARYPVRVEDDSARLEWTSVPTEIGVEVRELARVLFEAALPDASHALVGAMDELAPEELAWFDVRRYDGDRVEVLPRWPGRGS